MISEARDGGLDLDPNVSPRMVLPSTQSVTASLAMGFDPHKHHEGYFSVLKRDMKGTYQHCGKQHLHRYLAEFDFRYNNRSKLGIEDAARTVQTLRGIVGNRLTYRDSSPGV